MLHNPPPATARGYLNTLHNWQARKNLPASTAFTGFLGLLLPTANAPSLLFCPIVLRVSQDTW